MLPPETRASLLNSVYAALISSTVRSSTMASISRFETGTLWIARLLNGQLNGEASGCEHLHMAGQPIRIPLRGGIPTDAIGVWAQILRARGWAMSIATFCVTPFDQTLALTDAVLATLLGSRHFCVG